MKDCGQTCPGGPRAARLLAWLLLASLAIPGCGLRLPFIPWGRPKPAPDPPNQVQPVQPIIPGEGAAAKGISWTPLFRGIDYAHVESTEPPLQVHALRVDLRDPDIRFLVSPSNGDRPVDVDGMKTSTFLKTSKCQAAVNASPYAPVAQEEGAPKDVAGLSISIGDKYSIEEPNRGALLISRDNKAWIAAPPFDTSNAWNGVGGFELLLRDGKNLGGQGPRHPRTAAGISKDNRYLYLMVIDGRQPGYSEGVTSAENAAWLARLGAWSGVNLDGGGSSAMVIDDGHGGAKILNRPIHANVPGTERVNANNLGIYARSLE